MHFAVCLAHRERAYRGHILSKSGEDFLPIRLECVRPLETGTALDGALLGYLRTDWGASR